MCLFFPLPAKVISNSNGWLDAGRLIRQRQMIGELSHQVPSVGEALPQSRCIGNRMKCIAEPAVCR